MDPDMAPGALPELFDAASALAACGLALAVVTLGRGRPFYAVALPAFLITALAACDLLELHTHTAQFVTGLLPLQTVFGVSCFALVKLGLSIQIFGSAVVLLVSSPSKDMIAPLLAWVCGLALVSVAFEALGFLIGSDLPIFRMLEELAEILVTTVSLLALVTALTAPLARPDDRLQGAMRVRR